MVVEPLGSVGKWSPGRHVCVLWGRLRSPTLHKIKSSLVHQESPEPRLQGANSPRHP